MLFPVRTPSARVLWSEAVAGALVRAAAAVTVGWSLVWVLLVAAAAAETGARCATGCGLGHYLKYSNHEEL